MRSGHLVSLGGALVLVVALWLPWYTIELPPEMSSALGGEAANLPAGWAELARGLAAVLASSLTANGWESLSWADVVLVVVAAVVVAVTFAALESAAAVARAGGLLAAVVVVSQLVDQPGPSAASQFLAIEPGAWVALAGAVAIGIGGVSAGAVASPSTPASAPVAAWDAPSAPASVPPPGL